MCTDGTCAEDEDGAWEDAWDAAEEDAATAVIFLEVGSADLDGHAACDFAHGGKEGEGAVGELDGFVSDGDGVALKNGLGEGFGGGEVKESEEDLIGADEGEFLWLGFFDFCDEVGLGVDFLWGVEDDGAGLGVVFVGEIGG